MNRPQSQALRRRTFFGSMAALAVLVVGVTAQFVLHEREQAIDENFATAALHARAFEDHLSQRLNVIDLTLVNLAEHEHALSPKDLAAALRRAPYLRSVALLDADGRIVASSNARNLGRLVALAGFLPAALEPAEVLRVGPAWTGRDFADGQPSAPGQASSADTQGFVPVSREVVLGNGRRVTLLAAVNSDFFINHFTQVLDAASATVELLRFDGTLLLSTGAARMPGVHRGTEGVTTRLAQSEFGRFEQRLEDGTAILTAYRASPAHPLVIVVEIDKALALAGWPQQAAITVTVVLAALLAAMALASRFYFQIERAARVRDAAEAALQDSEARYRNTFEHAAIGVAHASPEGRLSRCNQHLCDMLGYSEAELTQKTIDEITYPDDLAEELILRERLLSGELPHYQTEKRYLRKSGEPVWVRLSAGAVRDASGGVASQVAVIEDIHLRKLTSLAMASINTELTGEAFMRQTTRTLTQLLGVEWAFVGEADPASSSRMNARAVVGDGKFVADFSYDLAGTPCETVTANQLNVYPEQVQRKFPTDALLGTMGVESYAAVPLGSTAEGTPLGVLAVMSRRPMHSSDAAGTLLPLLAVRVSAELVRQREARKFRDLFDGSPSAIFLVDKDATIRLSSRSGERLFGWGPHALNGRNLAMLFPVELRAALWAKFRRFVAASSTGAIDGEGSTDSFSLRRDGSTFPSQTHLRVLETAEGRMTVAHVQDIAERKDAEAHLRRFNEELESTVAMRTAELVTARDEAEQANRAKSAFLAAMSHEIRTPMNGVVGMIDVLEQTSLKGSQVEIVKTVRESAYALLNIVDDVLDFSKIEAGQFQVDSDPLSVAAVVEGVCDTLDLLAGKKGVELTLFTDPALPSQVLGDALRLRQVLLNLAGNAIKFSSATGRSGRVCVRARLVESGLEQAVLEFNVVDNGIGMDQDTLSRLFTPFTQADASTTRRFGGTGLGLSISHGLVSLMGGEIAVSSELDRGSKFSVRLPLPVLPAAPGDGEVDLAGLVCLVLGGSEGVADDLAVYLAHAGAAVHRAADRAAAGQWFGHCPPGLCVVVLTGAGAAVDETLAELRAASSSGANLQACFVLVQRGRRRTPRGPSDQVVSLDGDVLRRGVFLKAVALAAGRAAQEVEPPTFEADTMPAPLSMQEASAQGRLILVAEDNEINQKVVLRQLRLLGFKADIAGTGREALECWQRSDYALLLTDLHMPQMDGYELAVAIRQAEAGERRMPIVALTANAVKGEAKRCRELGMDDYMTKPVQLATLKAMLAKWLPVTARPTPAAAAPRPALPAAALDVNVLRALIGDDPAVIKEFLHDFHLSALEAAVQMRAACEAFQAPAVEAVAHRLKSSARAVGALALGDICEQLEAAGQAGHLATLAELWPRFNTEMAAVDAFLAASHVRSFPQPMTEGT